MGRSAKGRGGDWVGERWGSNRGSSALFRSNLAYLKSRMSVIQNFDGRHHKMPALDFGMNFSDRSLHIFHQRFISVCVTEEEWSAAECIQFFAQLRAYDPFKVRSHARDTICAVLCDLDFTLPKFVTLAYNNEKQQTHRNHVKNDQKIGWESRFEKTASTVSSFN